MKKYFALLLLVLISGISNSQEENHYAQLLDSVISTSKEISYYSSSVNWDSLSQGMHALAVDPKNVSDLKPAFTLMLNELRDHHGKIMSTTDYSIIAHFDDWKNKRFTDERAFPSEQWTIVNNLEARFEYAILEGNVGYLKIVGIGGNLDGQMEAERIRKAVRELAKKNVEHWIVDLRYNGGGNINVMLEGIAPLVDAERVVSVLDETNQLQVTADVIDGHFWYAGNNVFQAKKGPNIKQAKIAILTSRWTVSSGELVAVAFKGQKDVKFFGEATGGYTTNTGWTVLDDEIAVVIATGVYADRDGEIYHKNVPVDVEIEFEIEEDISKDNGIIQATKWLKND